MVNTRRSKTTAFLGTALLVMMIVLQGCPIVAVAIYAAYNNEGDISITAEIPRSAPEIFEAAKKRASRGVAVTGEAFTVTHIDEANFTMRLEAENGTWRGTFIIVPIGARTSQLTATGSDDLRTKDESEHLVLIAIENVCKDLKVKYRVIGRTMAGGPLE